MLYPFIRGCYYYIAESRKIFQTHDKKITRQRECVGERQTTQGQALSEWQNQVYIPKLMPQVVLAQGAGICAF